MIIAAGTDRSLAETTEAESGAVESGVHELMKARWLGVWNNADPTRTGQELRTAIASLVAAKAALQAIGTGPLSLVDSSLALPALDWCPPAHLADFGALPQIDRVVQALEEVANRADDAAAWRPSGGTGRGRRGQRIPYDVALVAARLFRLLAHKPPTYRTGGATRFSTMLRSPVSGACD